MFTHGDESYLTVDDHIGLLERCSASNLAFLMAHAVQRILESLPEAGHATVHHDDRFATGEIGAGLSENRCLGRRAASHPTRRRPRPRHGCGGQLILASLLHPTGGVTPPGVLFTERRG